MPTKKLFYENAYQKSFRSRVRACEPDARGWAVWLEESAFYPEGGGQPGDTGTLGGVRVLDTLERGGEPVHICDGPLVPGTPAAGEVDFGRRFDFMQQHSGEHIVSGLIHARFGFHNVGFHMGADVVTIDFDGLLCAQEAAEIERAANERVWADLPVEVSWPEAEELERLAYRSKKALTGPVRIVTIPGTDTCACCGTHVARTGEIGLIKLLGCQKLRGGVRMELVCGARAYDYVSRILDQNREISQRFSAKPLETAQAAARVQAELERAKYRLVGLESRHFAALARAHAGAQGALVFEEGLDADGVRRLAAALLECCCGVCAVFSRDGEGFKYAVGCSGGDVRALVKEMNLRLNGRGGGKPGFAQGSACCTQEEVTAFFAARGLG